MLRKFGISVVALCSLLILQAPLAQATPVDVYVNPGDYDGYWRVRYATGHLKDAQTVSLEPGWYWVGVGRGQFMIVVESDGQVTVPEEYADCAAGGPGTLTFNNYDVTVQRGDYTGLWKISYVLDRVSSQDDVTLTLVPGIRYQFSFGLGTAAWVKLKGDGWMEPENAAHGVGGDRLYTFNSVPVSVDRGLYEGSWSVQSAYGLNSDSGTVYLVPDNRYRFAVGWGTAVDVTVSATGLVTPDKDHQAIGGPNTLYFNTLPISVQRGTYGGGWNIQYAHGLTFEDDVVELVPDNHFRFSAGYGSNIDVTIDEFGIVTPDKDCQAIGGDQSLTFKTKPLLVQRGAYAGTWTIQWAYGTIAEDATVELVPDTRVRISAGYGNNFDIYFPDSGDVQVLNGVSATGGAGWVLFNATPVDIDPGTYTGGWTIQWVASGSGPTTLMLVPGANYHRLHVAGSYQDFRIDHPCGVTPSSFDIAGYEFNITCGSIDADADGVPDENDNCPDVANADQVDQDQDGLGDVCDADLDGDGVDNTADNCPDAANADQADLDGDGVGDECDADADGDAVPDAEDNCPVDANSDQADSDADLLGDVCDPDDDNDGVDDEVDNCPVDANADQADFDGDGEGDACDGDADGDGVINQDDLCAGSPADLPVDATGCTASQHIARVCDPESFPQHGKYVSCVAHAAQACVDAGLIGPQDKSRFVREAAKNK